jgi:predicted PurR-regulated permease PerM
VLERVHLPRGVAVIFVILVLFGTLGGLGTALSVPAASWAQKLLSGTPKLEERRSFLSRPIATFQKVIDQAEGLTQGSEPKAVPVAVRGSGLSNQLLSGTRSFASGLLESVLVLFFLLVSGDTFLRSLVEILPRFREKRQAVDISKLIESDVSAYLFTITIMNLAVGMATGAVVAVCGVGDPVLWETVAFLLNYIPILGPMLGVVVFLLAGLLLLDSLWAAFLPAGLYLLIHLIEGETVNANAARPALHHRLGAGHPLAPVLVLDEGRTRGDPLNPMLAELFASERVVEQRRKDGAVSRFALTVSFCRRREKLAGLVIADGRRGAFAAVGLRSLDAFDRVLVEGFFSQRYSNSDDNAASRFVRLMLS